MLFTREASSILPRYRVLQPKLYGSFQCPIRIAQHAPANRNKIGFFIDDNVIRICRCIKPSNSNDRNV